MAALWLAPAPALADPVSLIFRPPEVAPQALCRAGTGTELPDDITAAASDDAALTDALRLTFINRDIRRLQADDPARWFDFILALIDWKATLDPAFDANDVMLAQVDLMIDAGRMADLASRDLIGQLTAVRGRLNGAQKMRLAQLYQNGIGVAPDVALAQALTIEAAFSGNPDALLAIARAIAETGAVPGWDVPADLTVTLAFTGLLGQLDQGVCRRAERIARLYRDGTIVAQNPQLALEWTRFSADLGDAQAAWRIAEAELAAGAQARDRARLLRYLTLAVERGITLKPQEVAALETDPGLEVDEIRRILGLDQPQSPAPEDEQAGGRIDPYLTLAVNLSDDEVSRDSPWLRYLEEVSRLPAAPGFVFTRLADEVIIREGRWAGEARAEGYLDQAVQRGDPEGLRRLAAIQLRYGWDAARVNRAENLLLEAATRGGDPLAMAELDSLYRCQWPTGPQLAQAQLWADNYAATGDATVDVGPGDVPGLDPFMDPEVLATMQAQAMEGRFGALARLGLRLQRDAGMSEAGLRHWGARMSSSPNALEDFALFEYTLASNPAARDAAVSRLRRVYLNNGPTTALDLAISLARYGGRDPAVQADIIDALTVAANRGEGAAIRLLARLQAPERPAAEVFAEFAEVIEARGDFLALMFAIPFVPTDRADDYLARAVSVMSCTSKDVEELADAHAFLGRADGALHWKRVGLAMAGGHTLSRLALSDRTVAGFGTGAAPTAAEVLARELAEGVPGARRSLFALTADPDLPGYDPAAAAGWLLGALQGATPDDETWVMHAFRTAPAEVRAAAEGQFDMRGLFARVAGRGDVVAARELGLLLRDTAPADPAGALRWLTQAAEGGDVTAMAELGRMMALGLAGPTDRAAALVWLDRAAAAGDADAADLAQLLRGPQP